MKRESLKLAGAATILAAVAIASACSTAAASVMRVNAAIVVTLANGDEVSLVVDSEDPVARVVTYVGTDDSGHPAGPADVELGLAAELTDFDLTYHNSGYVLAVNTDTDEAYTIEYDEDAGQISAVVRTIQGQQLATATATGAWEMSYPVTQGVNMTTLLPILVLQAGTGCEPHYSEARQDCRIQCSDPPRAIKSFKYTCDPSTGAVSIECVCHDDD